MPDALPLSVLDLDGRPVIGDGWSPSAGERTFTVSSPIDGTPIAEVVDGTPEDVDAAVRVAAARFDHGGWSRMSAASRRAVLLRWAELLEGAVDELGSLITHEMGKPVDDARGEVLSAVGCLRFYAEAIDKVYGEVVPVVPDAFSYVAPEPLGVVGAVTPWNYPLSMPMWKLAPALAAGNSVVLKPADQTPLTALRAAHLALQAGLPEGALNVVPGGAVAGEALGRHPAVDVIAFTGSTAVGKRFLAYSAESNMKAVWLECGGKSAQVVLADAPDVAAAAREVAAGIFTNTGQVCNAGSRLVLDRAVREPLLAALLDATAEYTPGDPRRAGTTMGPLVDEAQLHRFEHYVGEGTRAGADVLVGGHRVLEDWGGSFVAPTVFVGVDNDMTIAQEEIFGPVLSVIEVDGLDQAIEIANGTRYGLAASVWTGSVSTAHRAARALRAGMVWVNTFDRGSMAMPFGGVRESGHGVDRSLHALAKYQSLKSTWIAL